MNKKQIIEALEKLNPYPESVFTEPDKDDYELLQKMFKSNGLVSDKFFGTWGRIVWNNCIRQLKELLEDGEDESIPTGTCKTCVSNDESVDHEPCHTCIDHNNYKRNMSE